MIKHYFVLIIGKIRPRSTEKGFSSCIETRIKRRPFTFQTVWCKIIYHYDLSDIACRTHYFEGPFIFLAKFVRASVVCETVMFALDNRSTNNSQLYGMTLRRGALGFSVLWIGQFLDRFFGFHTQKLRFFTFGVFCGLRFFIFLSSGFRFSTKILAVFWIRDPMCFQFFS